MLNFIKRVNYWMTPVYELIPPFFFREKKRRLHVYCVGMPKSGTVSLGELFSSSYRAAHEPEVRFLTRRVLAYKAGRLSRKSFIDYLRRRDRRMQLDMDSSYLNFEIVSELAEAFPESKFILTIRDCEAWLESFINFQLNKPEFMSRRKAIFKKHINQLLNSNGYVHGAEEKPLFNAGLYSLDGYLNYWTEHNKKVIDSISSNRLLVIRTEDINSSVAKIEDFLGLPPGDLPEPIVANVVPKRHSILDKVDKGYLKKKVDEHCFELMEKYFSSRVER